MNSEEFNEIVYQASGADGKGEEWGACEVLAYDLNYIEQLAKTAVRLARAIDDPDVLTEEDDAFIEYVGG